MTKLPPKNAMYFDLFYYFFRLSWTAFGGPFAYISMMEDDCVEKKRWLSKDEFVEMLGITNMLPGPNATEMAIHIGYVRGGRLGGILSGLGFTVPSFLIMLVLSWLYFQYGTMPSVGGFFYAINPVVIAIILATVFRLGKSSITDWKLIGIFIATVLAALFTNINEALILFSAGLVGVLLYGSALRRAIAIPAFLLFSPSIMPLAFAGLPLMAQLFLEFLKASSLLFGTGLVIIPLIGPDVVEGFGWMSYKEFFDGVTLGQITPGPVMKTAAFVGYKVAGVWGATVAMSGMFLPPFLIVLLLAPFFREIKRIPWLQGFLKGVRVGAVGVILAVLGSLVQTAFPDLLTIAIAVVSLVAILKFKVNMSLLVILAGALGVLIRLL
jgi:chromate transporter